MEKDIKKKIKKIKNNTKSLIIGLIVAVLIVIIAFIGIVGWGIYKLDWRGQFVDQVVKIIPYPAASVDGSFISYKIFFKAVKISEKFYEKQKEAGFMAIPGQAELEKDIMEDRLIENELVKKISKKYNISVSQSEIEEKIDEIIKRQGSREEVEKFLAEYYGINLEEYKKYFTKPNLLYDKTSEAVIDDESLNAEPKKKIQEALSKLRDGDEFEEVAKQYSEDEMAEENASLENFLRGELPQDIEDQLFSMQEGEFTDILTLADRFVIFKLEKKDEEKGVLTLKRIIVNITTLDDLIKEAIEKAQIKIYAY